MNSKEVEALRRDLRSGKRLLFRERYCNQRMRQRGIDVQDLWRVIQRGRLLGAPEALGDGEFEIRLQGKTLDGHMLRVILAAHRYGVVRAINVIVTRVRRSHR